MRPEARARVDALPPNARVLDVGGGASPLARADVVLDLLPRTAGPLYAQPGATGPARAGGSRPDAAGTGEAAGTGPAGRVGPDAAGIDDAAGTGPAGTVGPDAAGTGDATGTSRSATWTRLDVCARTPWPFADDAFDVAVCSHTLEDVRDPVGVCAELSRVARAGYVEVPAPVEELTWGVQGPWVGWSHHRWVCEPVLLAPGTAGARLAGEEHELVGDDRLGRAGAGGGVSTDASGDAAPASGGPATARPHPAPAGVPGLRLTHKPHLLAEAGRHLPAGTADRLGADDRVVGFWWEGSLPCEEVVHVGAETLDPWLAGLLATGAGAAGVPAPHAAAPGPAGVVARLRRRARRRRAGRSRSA